MLASSRRRSVGSAIVLALSLLGLLGAASPSPRLDDTRLVDDSLRGRSGKLFARFVSAEGDAEGRSLLARLFGDSAVGRAGVYRLADSGVTRPFAFVALHPFSAKRGAVLGSYRIGFWPGEQGTVRSEAYGNPTGFIEVTRENQNLYVSEHFRLRDFLTHDQASVWPKYLVLRETLIDKLELVIAELERGGVAVRHMAVMSGFRTPQYNAAGGNTAGRAQLSRHMYGDASDVFVDNNGDGRMDDLNRDGRIDHRDAQVIVAAAERVERAFGDLIGGGGVYKATSGHGPFAHIDVRGNRARWGTQ